VTHPGSAHVPDPTPPHRSAARALVSAGWVDALGYGLIALAAAGVFGQVIAWVIQAGGAGLSAVTTLRLGWLYTSVFHGVPLRVELHTPAALLLFGSEREGVSGSVRLALLTGTACVLVSAWWAGRAVARRTGGGAVARCAHGAKVAVPYVLGFVGVSLVSEMEIATRGIPVVSVRPSVVGSFAWPLVIVAVSGSAGGLHGATAMPQGRRARLAIAATAGGWHALVVGMGLSLLALLGLAAVHPDAAAAYAKTVSSLGPRWGALLVGNQVLGAPNQAMFILAPAMGSCDAVVSASGSLNAVCLWRLPDGIDGALLSPGVGRPPATRAAPPEIWLVVLVPLAATVLGGRRAARRFRAVEGRDWVMIGASTGGAFAVLAATAAFVSDVGLSGELFGAAAGTIGPRPLTTGVVAFAWGVVGGCLGALIESRRAEDSTEQNSG
jgi:hypothetical protein